MAVFSRLFLRRAVAAIAVASLVAALALPAIVTAASGARPRGWALLLRGPAESPAAFGLGWAGVALLALAVAWQWRGRAAVPAALGGLLVAAFGAALGLQDWLAGAWLWAGALAAAWVGSSRWLDPVLPAARAAAETPAAGASTIGAPGAGAPTIGVPAAGVPTIGAPTVGVPAVSTAAPPGVSASAPHAAAPAAPAPVPPAAPAPVASATAAAPAAPRRPWRPGRRFWLWTIGLWLAAALHDRAIDLFASADEVRRTTAGPIDAIELLREGTAAASPMLGRPAAAAAGYREVVIGPRRYRAAAGADAYFVAPAGAAPRWLVVERRSRPDGFWSRRLRRFAILRIVDRERGETIATWRGPVAGRGAGTDAEQAAAFVRSVLPPGPPASRAPRVALRASVRIEPSQAAERLPSRVAGCASDARLVEATGAADPDRGEELVTAQWTYGLDGGIGSVFCDAGGVTVEHGRRPAEHQVDRIDPAGLTARRLTATDPPDADPIADGGEARLVAVRATRDGLSLRKRQFAPEPPRVAVRDVVIDFEPPVVERQPAARKPSGRRGAGRTRRR